MVSRAVKRYERGYASRVEGVGIFENDLRTAYPQTIVAELVRRHFAGKGGKKKKALIVGFDAARADALINLVQSNQKELSGPRNCDSRYSAICRLRREGGLYLAYAGGIEGDKATKQGTSTAQGWTSILTGVWANEHGVDGMDIKKENCPSFLLEFAREGITSAYVGLWEPMYDTIFKLEAEEAKQKALPYSILLDPDDEYVHQCFLDAIHNDTDCIFGVYDAPDDNGHASGWGNLNYRYIKAVADCDRNAYHLIEEVERRETFPQEDWLIIITADHGGHNRGHGTQNVQDRTTFIACNQKIPADLER